MRSRTLISQILIILIFSTAFVIHELASRGTLQSAFLYSTISPPLRRVQTFFTDIKFKLRGHRPVTNPIVIVEVDGPSLDKIGRWPWRRDHMALLIERLFELGAKIVATDIIFAEPETPLSEDFAAALDERGLGELTRRFETDPVLASVIRRHSGQLVLVWGSDTLCQPLFSKRQDCDVLNTDALESHPTGFERFSIPQVTTKVPFSPEKTPIVSMVTVTGNLASFNDAAKYQGFVTVDRDPDGLYRRMPLVSIVGGRPHPSLALQVASLAREKPLEILLDRMNRIERLGFKGDSHSIPITPSGISEINYRGGDHTFAYLSAVDVFSEDSKEAAPNDRKVAGVPKTDPLRNAIVFVGVTALGLHDIRPTPFDNQVPGTEVQATMTDNLLSEQLMVSGAAEPLAGAVFLGILFVMTLGMFSFAYYIRTLDAVQAMVLAAATFGCMALLDLRLFFTNHNWTTSFFYLELFSVTGLTIATRYIVEERRRKYMRYAMSKYVAPAIVDAVVKDPSQLHVGGAKKNLTVLFSDVRNFTTLSEGMDAKLLTEFLNTYFGLMTDIVFSHGGTLDKYIGDALMAFFGAPVDRPTHAQDACRAALAMLAATETAKPRFKARYGIELKIGIGVNTGTVAVGNMGSEQNFGYTVIGDPVNLAARLVGASKKYGVDFLTTHFTLGEMSASGEELPPFRIVDLVKVKGKKDAVQLIQFMNSDTNERGLSLFEDARECYRQRKWDEAITLFQEVIRLLARPEQAADGPASLFIARCQQLKHEPPREDWDGTWSLEDK